MPTDFAWNVILGSLITGTAVRLQCEASDLPSKSPHHELKLDYLEGVGVPNGSEGLVKRSHGLGAVSAMPIKVWGWCWPSDRSEG